MQDFDSLIPIILGEALLISIAIIVVLLLQLIKLRRVKRQLMEKLKSKKRSTSQPLDNTMDTDESEADITYEDFIDAQIESTLDYHQSQSGHTEIALDIDPNAPLYRRTAALRHAILIAEKECFGLDSDENWDLLACRYQNILQFHDDFSSSTDNESLEELENALAAANKRITNLEKFRQLYFDLEKQWNESKTAADGYYEELKAMGPESNESQESFNLMLQNYQGSYQGIGNMIDRENEKIEAFSDTNVVEISRLRKLTAEQNHVIDDLKNELIKAKTDTSLGLDEQTLTLIDNMEAELNRQARFMAESETCIHLMEEELNAANKELTSLRAKADKLPQIRQQLRAAQDSENQAKQVINTLKKENKRQAQTLKTVSETPSNVDSGATKKLRSELTTMEAKYAELEERYLDLKLQS